MFVDVDGIKTKWPAGESGKADAFVHVMLGRGRGADPCAAFELAGRSWAFLVPRPSQKCPQAVFFAEEGPGLEPVKAAAVREWHFPLSANPDVRLGK